MKTCGKGGKHGAYLPPKDFPRSLILPQSTSLASVRLTVTSLLPGSEPSLMEALSTFRCAIRRPLAKRPLPGRSASWKGKWGTAGPSPERLLHLPGGGGQGLPEVRIYFPLTGSMPYPPGWGRALGRVLAGWQATEVEGEVIRDYFSLHYWRKSHEIPS